MHNRNNNPNGMHIKNQFIKNFGSISKNGKLRSSMQKRIFASGMIDIKYISESPTHVKIATESKSVITGSYPFVNNTFPQATTIEEF